MAPVKATINFRLPYKVQQEEDLFVSCCPVIDVVSQGTTQQESMENLVEAISLFFEECFYAGTLLDVLKQSGFAPHHPEADKQVVFRQFEDDLDYLEVPVPLLAEFTNGETRIC